MPNMTTKENDTNMGHLKPQVSERQIRMWVLDGQKQLKSSKILVIGMNGLGCQVAKKLAVAGVKSLKMLHHKDITAEDGVTQFQATRDNTRLNRPETFRKRRQLKNPIDKVKGNSSNGEKVEVDLLKKFDIIIATNCEKEKLIKINNMCRKKESIMFLSPTSALSVSRVKKTRRRCPNLIKTSGKQLG